jgi:hypothetical protein
MPFSCNLAAPASLLQQALKEHRKVSQPSARGALTNEDGRPQDHVETVIADTEIVICWHSMDGFVQ